MRELRLVLEGEEALYAISNEIALHLVDLTTDEQSFLEKIIHDVARFCGVSIIAWHVTPRGYGALVRVPPASEISDKELVKKVSTCFGVDHARAFAEASGKELEALRRRYRKKLYSLREYCRLFQTRFSREVNRQNGRRGQLWRQRFRSFLLEDIPEVRTRYAGYLHTRPYGAPDEGPFSSLVWAESGHAGCRANYRALTGKRTWDDARGSVGVAMDEMAERVVRPSCGSIDPGKLEAARKRSRDNRKRALLSDAAWMGYFEAYQSHVAETGSHRFSRQSEDQAGLRSWVHIQRACLRRGSISERRRQLLESIDFPANTRKRPNP
ncbi:MAG: helicase associated domain-containing protein [Desulfobacterales bacterium]|nr:helicase associated domain-containing protein [Desulfobacterales bacterium]